LSKIVITADQKALRTLSESFLIRATSVSSIATLDLVELTGIEPATYGLQSRRSPS
jgi:hypothetical protein